MLGQVGGLGCRGLGGKLDRAGRRRFTEGSSVGFLLALPFFNQESLEGGELLGGEKWKVVLFYGGTLSGN